MTSANYRLGQAVRIGHVDMNGLCGRDPHPTEAHEGCIGRIIASCIDEMPVGNSPDAFILADTLAHLDDDDPDYGCCTFLHTVLLETPGGDEVLVFADYELIAV